VELKWKSKSIQTNSSQYTGAFCARPMPGNRNTTDPPAVEQRIKDIIEDLIWIKG
jgi:hypothetical protein